MTEPIKIPTAGPHDHCFHPSIKNKPGHGQFATSFLLTVESLKTEELPDYLHRFEFCCFCGMIKP